MTSSLSEDEFQRLQEQLISLKSDNYTLEDKIRKIDNENQQWRKKYEELEKQNSLKPLATFAKQHFNIRNSSKDKDTIEKLVRDNEKLEKLLQTQEEDFRKTNETLREEINYLLRSKDGGDDEAKHESEVRDGDDVDEKEIADERSETEDAQKQSIPEDKDELESELIKLRSDYEKIWKENKTLIAEVENVNLKLNEINKKSEKRKEIIDEMKTFLNETKKENELNLTQLTDEKNLVIEKFELEIKELTTEKDSLNERLSLSDELIAKLRENEINLNSKLAELDEQFNLFKVNAEDQLQSMKSDFEKTLSEESEKFEKIRTELSEKNETLSKNLEIELNNFNSVKQQLNDLIEERKINERKGIMMMKELKRQLKHEQQRSKNMQDKLQELSIIDDKTLFEDCENKLYSNQQNDSSSVGSWSFVTVKDDPNGGNADTSVGNISVASIGSDSKQISPTHSAHNMSNAFSTNTQLEDENAQLVKRITNLQQEKWLLEEKVNQFEIKNNNLVEEFKKKADLIEYYCMEGKVSNLIKQQEQHDDDRHQMNNHFLPKQNSIEKISVKRVFDFIKVKSDENLKDINRRLVRMLEEILTKNMHLEKDIERLADENMRLTRLTQKTEIASS